MLCPKCKKEQLRYFPWLGQMWKCSCGYSGPLAVELTGRALLQFLRKIPKGKVVTYKSLGKKFEMHPRAVAKALSKNIQPNRYPCYKVVGSNGELGGYSGKGGVRTKRVLLKADGIEIKKGKVDLKKFEWVSKIIL